jgi:hypothetical protein
MSNQNRQAIHYTIPAGMGGQISQPTVKEASPLAKEIEQLHSTICNTDKLVDELFNRLNPILLQEPPQPVNATVASDSSVLSEIPLTVKVSRVKLENLNEGLSRLLRNLQC